MRSGAKNVSGGTEAGESGRKAVPLITLRPGEKVATCFGSLLEGHAGGVLQGPHGTTTRSEMLC